MPRVWLAAAVLTILGLGACGAGSEGSPAAAGCEGVVAGDFVITEVLANPAGDDAGKEWFELYNASGAERSLRGLRLVAARADGTSEKTHMVGADGPVVAAGGYVVVGDGQGAGYAYGKDLGGLANGGGRLAVRCGAEEIDAVAYDTVSEGRSRQLDGAAVPDALANDDASRWCSADATPGAANATCPVVAAAGTCQGPGGPRPTTIPGAGDLRITEVLADPRAVADASGEWFEVSVLRDVDLNGLEIGAALGSPRTTVGGAACVHVAAGARLVFAHVADPAQDGGLPRVDQVFGGPALGNTKGAIVLSVGGVLVDEVAWLTSRPGVASARDPASGAWCAASAAYGAGDLGTPGEANQACPPVVPDGMCLDDAGSVRAIVAPAAGELWISEVLADPAAVADTAGEWIELGVGGDFDLNGVQLGNVPPLVKTTLAASRCLQVSTGALVVLAHGEDPAQNGGLPAVDARFGFALGNGGSGVFVGVGGAVLDAATWTSATPGASRQLRPAACVTPPGHTYGAGDRGTPGAENLPCE
jgi:hypothetical protein